MRRKDQQVPTGEQLEPGESAELSSCTRTMPRAARTTALEAHAALAARAALLLDLRAALLETRYLGYEFGERNLDGREQAHAPQYQFDLGVEYRGARGLFARIDFAGLDDFYFDASHDERAPVASAHSSQGGLLGNTGARKFGSETCSTGTIRSVASVSAIEPPDSTPTRYVQAGDPRHAGVTVTYTFR